MTSRSSRLFTDHDRARIQQAVHDAEHHTSGEIVPCIVDACDAYEEAEWRLGALCGGAVLTALAGMYALTPAWSAWNLLESLLGVLLAGGVGMTAAKLVPALKRTFAGSGLLQHRVGLRAWEAFVREEVFKTRERTGILLFVALLERKVVVLGDAGINARVAPGDWEGVVERIVAGLREGKAGDGMVDAIRQCGVLLERQGVARRGDDTDELTNDLRTGRR
jgi:putative membrane protein